MRADKPSKADELADAMATLDTICRTNALVGGDEVAEESARRAVRRKLVQADKEGEVAEAERKAMRHEASKAQESERSTRSEDTKDLVRQLQEGYAELATLDLLHILVPVSPSHNRAIYGVEIHEVAERCRKAILEYAGKTGREDMSLERLLKAPDFRKLAEFATQGAAEATEAG